MGSNELNIPTRGMKRSASASEEPLGNEVALVRLLSVTAKLGLFLLTL